MDNNKKNKKQQRKKKILNKIFMKNINKIEINKDNQWIKESCNKPLKIKFFLQKKLKMTLKRTNFILIINITLIKFIKIIKKNKNSSYSFFLYYNFFNL